MGAEVPRVQCDMAQTGEAENSPDEREEAEGESPQSDHGKPEQISESDPGDVRPQSVVNVLQSEDVKLQ